MSADTKEPGHEQTFTGIVRLIREEDIPQLQPILETWIRDSDTHEPLPDEIASLMEAMRLSISGKNDRIYMVAENTDKQIAGVMGFKNPDETMRSFAKTHNPAELINAYVAQRGGGVGSALIRGIEAEAGMRGYTEIILNSGPRYKDTGWGFYDRQPEYKRVGVAKQMYKTGDAPVWSKILPRA
jgi:GNAT superfamily N-acetyltransferase